MSVMCFSSIEIKELFQMVKFHEEILTNSLGDDSNNKLIITITLNMALIANRVAYAVQYAAMDDSQVYFDDITLDACKLKRYFEESINPIECSKEELHKKLSSLRYNLYTNNGHIFLEDKYIKNIEKMLNCLEKTVNS